MIAGRTSTQGKWRLAALVVLLCVTQSGLAEQQTLRIGSYIQQRSTGISLVIKPWLAAVRQDVGERLHFDEYWGGVLGKHPHKQFELVRSGILDITWVLSAYTSGQFPELGLFELPFLFENAHESSLVGWHLSELGLLTGFEDVHLIGFFTTEPALLFMREPIASLDGLAGKKVRSLGAIHARWLGEFQAYSQTLSAVDMNQALSRNIIDGVIQGWTGMRTFKSFPLVEQSWSVPLGSTTFLLLMNRATWNSLAGELQQALMRHGGAAFSRVGGSAYTQAGSEIRNQLQAAGRLDIRSPARHERLALTQRTKPVHDWWIEKTPNGRAVYDAAIAKLKQLRGSD